MIGLEENFRKWLIKEGKGKTSTRQLILAINKVCQDFYNGNTEKHWRILTKHIVSILIYYNECIPPFSNLGSFPITSRTVLFEPKQSGGKRCISPSLEANKTKRLLFCGSPYLLQSTML